jgi:hypothetical protein
MLARRKDPASFRIWTEQRAADLFIHVVRRQEASSAITIDLDYHFGVTRLSQSPNPEGVPILIFS